MVAGKQIPHSVEAEESVLGALLIDPEAILRVLPFLRPEHFYLRKHRWLYEALVALWERREPLDLLTISRELESREHLEGVGGAAALATLMSRVPTAVNVESYARIVEQAYVRRQLIDAAGKIAKLAYDEERAIEEVVDQSERALFAVAQGRDERDVRPISEIAGAYWDWMERMRERRGEPVGIPGGFRALDQLLGGFQKSDLIILAARPGVGKTSLMLSMAVNVARRGHPVAFFSLEMSARQLFQRAVAAASGLDTQRLRLGNLRDDEWERFAGASGGIADLPLWIDDTPSLTPLQLRTKCRRLHAERGLDMVFVDYLQLMQAGRRMENRVQEVSYLSRMLKALARELDAPVMVASQLSRDLERRPDKRPVLSDLRGSGSIEQDADVVIFIYRDVLYHPETENPHLAELIVAKHRSGPTGTVQLIFDRARTRFLDARGGGGR